MAITDTPCTLPSRGLTYGGRIPGGAIRVKRLSAPDLTTLFSNGNEAERIDRTIDNIAILPDKFDAKDLLVTDRMAVLLSMRVLSFGTKYSFGYKCQGCWASQTHVTDLIEDLSETLPADDLAPTFDVKLPDAEKTVTLRFMTGRDEGAVMRHSKQATAAKSAADPGDPSNLFRQALLITAVDGESGMDVVKRQAFVRQLSARDSIIIDNEIDAREPGIDLTVRPECRKCGHANEFSLPFTLEFFRPTSLRA